MGARPRLEMAEVTALGADDSTGTDTLLAEADAAMSEAKRARKGRVVTYREAAVTA